MSEKNWRQRLFKAVFGVDLETPDAGPKKSTSASSSSPTAAEARTVTIEDIRLALALLTAHIEDENADVDVDKLFTTLWNEVNPEAYIGVAMGTIRIVIDMMSVIPDLCRESVVRTNISWGTDIPVTSNEFGMSRVEIVIPNMSEMLATMALAYEQTYS